MRLRIRRVPPATARIVPVLGLSNKAWGLTKFASRVELSQGSWRRRHSVRPAAVCGERRSIGTGDRGCRTEGRRGSGRAPSGVLAASDPSACSEVQDGKRRRPGVGGMASFEQRLDREQPAAIP